MMNPEDRRNALLAAAATSRQYRRAEDIKAGIEPIAAGAAMQNIKLNQGEIT
jgi:hypothetical protein